MLFKICHSYLWNWQNKLATKNHGKKLLQNFGDEMKIKMTFYGLEKCIYCCSVLKYFFIKSSECQECLDRAENPYRYWSALVGLEIGTTDSGPDIPAECIRKSVWEFFYFTKLMKPSFKCLEPNKHQRCTDDGKSCPRIRSMVRKHFLMKLVRTCPQKTTSVGASCYHKNYHEIQFYFHSIDFDRFHPSDSRPS